MTYTYAILEVSKESWGEIAQLLRAASYDHAFHSDDEHCTIIDMHGIALAEKKPEPVDIGRKVWSDAEETAFQAGVEAMRELAGYVAIHACLMPPDGGSPTEDEREMCAEVSRQIYAAGMPLKHDVNISFRSHARLP
jgi:hypothetical protein